MARLPQPGGDDGAWGDILNDFLTQALNADGTIKPAAVPVQSVNAKTGVVVLSAADVGAPTTLAALTDINVSGVADTQVLSYEQSSGQWIPATPSGGVVGDATAGSKGLIQLAGDLSGTAAVPTVPALSSKASDASVVHNTGVETVAGAKTFSSSPLVPNTPSGATAATSKTYVDTADSTTQTAAQTYADTQVATAPAFIMYSGGSYPSRSTATASSTRVVIWIGPTAPSVGGSGAVDGVDVWWRTP